MEKSRRCIKFDKNYLSSLKEDNRACVEVIKSTRHLSLHPFHLSNVNNSIKEILGEQVAKYDKKLNGILLSVQNIKLLRSIGAISFDSSYTHIDIEAEFFVFKPEVGKVMRGLVNKKSKDHVGCLVHKFFNVSLPRPVNCENWLGSATQIGNEIEFRITFTNLEARLPYIKGEIITLQSEDSGISTGEDGNNHGLNIITKFGDESAGEDVDDVEVSSSPKKNRKRKFNEHDHEDTESSHRKHKRRKLNSSLDETSSYTLTGLLNYIDKEEVPDKKRVEGVGEKRNSDGKRKKSKKDKPDGGVDQEGERISNGQRRGSLKAANKDTFSKKRKQKRRMSVSEENSSTIKKKNSTNELDLTQDLPRKLLCEKPPNTVEVKGKRKGKKNPDESLSDFNLSAIFDDVFAEVKPKSKKKHDKADGDEKLNPNVSSVATGEKSAKKKKSHPDFLELNFDDIINKSVVEKKSHDLNASKSKSEKKKKSKEDSAGKTNLARELFPLQTDVKSKKKKKIDLTLSPINFENLINESTVKAKEKRKKKSKDPNADVSLPELNFDRLFSEGVSNRHSTTSTNTSWKDKTFELPSDSDMENILSSCFPKSNQKSNKKKT